jgi:hypothetical protein
VHVVQVEVASECAQVGVVDLFGDQAEVIVVLLLACDDGRLYRLHGVVCAIRRRVVRMVWCVLVCGLRLRIRSLENQKRSTTVALGVLLSALTICKFDCIFRVLLFQLVCHFGLLLFRHATKLDSFKHSNLKIHRRILLSVESRKTYRLWTCRGRDTSASDNIGIDCD